MARTVRSALPLLLACAALALAACGDSGAGNEPSNGAGTGSSAPLPSASSSPAVPESTGPASAAETSLTVEFLADGETPSGTWTLQCDGTAPVGSSEAPDPAAACAVLADRGTELFAPPDANLMCTQIIKGQQRARVTGTVNGETVDQMFSLRDGCQIGRWESLTALLGPAEGNL